MDISADYPLLTKGLQQQLIDVQKHLLTPPPALLYSPGRASSRVVARRTDRLHVALVPSDFRGQKPRRSPLFDRRETEAGARHRVC